MKLTTHLAVAVFGFSIMTDARFGLWIAIAHLLPAADIVLRYIYKYNVLHTVWGILVMAFLYWANLPLIYPILVGMHVLHVVMDVLSPSGIEPFAPYGKKKLVWEVAYVETGVLTVSVIGTVAAALLRLTGYL